jgi:hypothetical protein
VSKLDIHTATAADFDAAAARYAHTFWIWALIAAAAYFFAKWWALIPLAFAVLSGARSMTSTNCADQLRHGKFRFANPNNGAPDGNATNRPPRQGP